MPVAVEEEPVAMVKEKSRGRAKKREQLARVVSSQSPSLSNNNVAKVLEVPRTAPRATAETPQGKEKTPYKQKLRSRQKKINLELL